MSPHEMVQVERIAAQVVKTLPLKNWTDVDHMTFTASIIFVLFQTKQLAAQSIIINP